MPDFVLRPRTLLAAVSFVALAGLPAVLLRLQWNASFFDARTPLIVGYAAVGLVVVVRARVVVAGGIVWRRVFARYRPVALNQLATVRFARARYLRREGLLPLGYLRLADRYGRRAALKPALWSHGPLLVATIAACARSQAIWVDDQTSERLQAAADPANVVPTWAYAAAVPAEPSDSASAATPAADRPGRTGGFWTRRNPDGTAKRAQPQRLLPVFAAMIVMVPLFIGVTRAGTSAIRSAKCSMARPRWADAPDFPTEAANPIILAQRVAATVESGVTGRLYRLGPANIANRYNTRAVRADAAVMTNGVDVQWANGRSVTAEIQIEQFPTHTAAIQMQRDYAEDHCHTGDHFFTPTDIPGGLGMRCNCAGSTVSDRISWVRGDTRVQAITWQVPARRGHGQVTTLAQSVLAADHP